MRITEEFPVAITFDIDWAPDFVIEMCVDLLRKQKIPATFFVTHDSDILNEIAADPLFELGIHPNFLPHSTHGDSMKAVLDCVVAMVPDSKLMRTHGLYQSSALYSEILINYPHIRYDLSLLVNENPYLFPFEIRDEHQNHLIRLPMQWEDDVYMSRSDQATFIFKKATYQVFNFHPIHVYLNSKDMKKYQNLKYTISKKPLFSASKVDFPKISLEDPGARTWLYTLIDKIPKNRFFLASELAHQSFALL